MKTQHTNSLGQNEGSPSRKVYTETCLHQKFERSQISKSMMCLKPFVKTNKQTNKLRNSRQGVIIKIRAKISEIETKIQRINETKG